MSDMDAYMKRIEATNFALANDDGAIGRSYDALGRDTDRRVAVRKDADLPVPGACNTVSIAANYPLTDEEFENGELPAILQGQKHKLYGLTIAPERLRQIRRERRPLGRYSTSQQVRFEIREAEKLFKRYAIPFVDTTAFSIEEIASRILDSTGVERRVRP